MFDLLKCKRLCSLLLTLVFATLLGLSDSSFAISDNVQSFDEWDACEIGLTNDSIENYGIFHHSGIYVGKFVMAEGSYYLIEDVTVWYDLMIPTGVTVNLCLNGHEYRANTNHIYVESGGTLNIYDCSSSDSGVINCTSNYTIQNEGCLKVFGGSIICTYNQSDICSAIRNNSSGVVSIFGGTLCSQSTHGGGSITISNGLSTDMATHTVNIIQGNVRAASIGGSATCISSNSIVNIEGGVFDSTGMGLSNNGTNAVMTIAGGVFNTTGTGISNNNGGSLIIEDGIINTKGGNLITCGVSNNAGSSHFLMTGGQIIVEAISGQNRNAYGIYNNRKNYPTNPGSCRIDGGNIVVKAVDSSSVGIENEYGYAIINGGKIDSTVSGTGKSVGLRNGSEGKGFIFGDGSILSPIEISGMTAIIDKGTISSNEEYRVFIGDNDYDVEDLENYDLYITKEAKWIPYIPSLELSVKGNDVIYTLNGGKGKYILIIAQYSSDGRMLDFCFERVETPIEIKKNLFFHDEAVSNYYRAFLLYDNFIPTKISPRTITVE